MLLSIYIWDLIELSRRSWFYLLEHSLFDLLTTKNEVWQPWSSHAVKEGLVYALQLAVLTVPSRGVCENAFNGLQSTVICAPRLRPQTYWSRDKPILLYPVQNLDWPNAWTWNKKYFCFIPLNLKLFVIQ